MMFYTCYAHKCTSIYVQSYTDNRNVHGLLLQFVAAHSFAVYLVIFSSRLTAHANIMFALLIICATIVVTIVSWYIYYYYCMRTLVNVNGPTPLPILGSALDFSSCDSKFNYNVNDSHIFFPDYTYNKTLFTKSKFK